MVPKAGKVVRMKDRIDVKEVVDLESAIVAS